MDLKSEAVRPAIALVSNSHTPYRLHLHRRIVREIPGIKLWSLYTHEISNAPWEFSGGEEIGAVLFGKGEHCDDQAKPQYALREWRRGGRIIRFLRENSVQFVLMLGYNDPGRLRIVRWCHRNHVPCWMFGDSNVRSDHATGIKAVVKRLLVGRVVRWCDGVMSCGRLGKDYFVKYGADPNRCHYFPYEPDYDLIESLTPEQIEQARKRFALDPSRRRLVFSGRLASVKRPDLLIESFKAIAEKRPNWDLLVIGDGPLRGDMQSRLPTELAGRVQWTGFMDDQATISALYRLCDILVLPSDYEPWALVVNEATAAGLAIVSSDVVGASAELLRDGVNGRSFPAGNQAALTQALLDVTDPAKIDAEKRASAKVLADWRRDGDPIQGLRSALVDSGVLKR